MVVKYQDMVAQQTTNEHVWEPIIDNAIRTHFTLSNRIVEIPLVVEGLTCWPVTAGVPTRNIPISLATIGKLYALYDAAGWKLTARPPQLNPYIPGFIRVEPKAV